MKRLNALVSDKKYREYLSQIETAETDRIFCKHDIQHFLDVSRLLYIYCLEEKLDIDKELVYAIGFLHDIGRAMQYMHGIEHHAASVEAARELLPKYGFDTEETAVITKAIGSHRNAENADRICSLTYKADKRSRPCYMCKAIGECNWSSDKINSEINI